MTDQKITPEAKAQAMEELKSMLKPGDTVHTVLRKVSASGMSRVIGFKHIGWDAKRVYSLDYLVATVCGYTLADYDGVKISGVGMDMGFAAVYNLSSALFAGGFQCTGENCPANDHVNDREIKRDGTHFHKNAGGYALSQAWL